MGSRSSSVRVKFYGQERERETRLGTRQFQLIQGVLLAVILCPRFCFKASESIRSMWTLQEIPACLPERWPVYGKREREVRNEGTRISDRGQRSVKFQTSLQEGLIAFPKLTDIPGLKTSLKTVMKECQSLFFNKFICLWSNLDGLCVESINLVCEFL
jgi:hypothetical protein